RERAAHRAKGSRQIQGADPRHDTPDTGVRSATVDQRAEAIHRGMARLLRLLPDSASPHEPRSVDPSKIAFVSLAAVAKRAKPLQRTTPSRHIEVQCGGGGRLAHGPLANVRTPVGPTGAAQQLFRLARSPPNLCARPSLTRSNRRGTDPYARWCGRGGAARHSPIPIPWRNPPVHESNLERQQRVCAVKGGAFQWVQVPPGETLQPEATGAVMEVTKWLKPSVMLSHFGDGASVRAATE